MTETVRVLLSSDETKTQLALIQWADNIWASSSCCGYRLQLDAQYFGPYRELWICGKCGKEALDIERDMPPVYFNLQADMPVNLFDLEKWVSAWSGVPVIQFELEVER